MLYWTDGLQTVHGELDEGTAHAHDINELLGIAGGGHGPEAAADASGHDDDLCVGVIAHCFEFLICCFYWDDISITWSFEHEIRRRPTDRREVISRITRIFFHADLTLYLIRTRILLCFFNAHGSHGSHGSCSRRGAYCYWNTRLL